MGYLQGIGLTTRKLIKRHGMRQKWGALQCNDLQARYVNFKHLWDANGIKKKGRPRKPST
jgi:hypothetical protein